MKEIRKAAEEALLKILVDLKSNNIPPESASCVLPILYEIARPQEPPVDPQELRSALEAWTK